MSAPTLPALDVDVFADLEAQLRDSIACEVENLLSETPPCDRPAKLVLRFRDVCAHGGMVDPGQRVWLLCCECAQIALDLLRYEPRYVCSGCHCRIRGDIAHVIHLPLTPLSPT